MKNWLHWLTKSISHNPWIFILAIIVVLFLYFVYGCESMVLFKDQKVTRPELQIQAQQIETDYLLIRADLLSQIELLDLEQAEEIKGIESAEAELQRQDEQKAHLAEGLVTLVNQFAPASVADPLNTILGILAPVGVGALILNGRRKDKVIVEEKAKNST